jgi:hypothetical protein
MKYLLRSTLLATVFSTAAALAAEPIKVKERVDILDLMKKGEVDYHINPGAEPADKPEEVFVLKDNQLTISGRGWGHMMTKSAFKDYHLVVEFKFTGKTWGSRVAKARDSGILVHCHGPLGAVGGAWPASVEAQIIEGGMGDFLVLSPKLPDGTVLQTSLDAEFELDRDKERRWKKGAVRQQVLSGRINWELRDEDWADVIDFRGKNDPDAPIGEWNKMEVIAKGDTIQILFNGRMVNEGFASKPSSGPVAIQTECAEMVVRRYELLPLGGEQR